MAKKKKAFKKENYSKVAQQYFHDDYSNGVFSEGKQVMRPLTKKEKKFLNEFDDATEANNHAKYKLFTEHPEYERIKKEIYKETNSRNNDISSLAYATRRIHSIEDVLSAQEEKETRRKYTANTLDFDDQDSVESLLKHNTYEEAVKIIFLRTADNLIKAPDTEEEIIKILRVFYRDLVSLNNIEIIYLKKLRAKKTAEKKK